MQTVRLTEDIPADGLAKGDLLTVDAFSAAALIKSKRAEEYDPAKAAADNRAEGGEELSGLTIDDIVDPEVARNRRTMTATIVGGPSAGQSVSQLADPNPVASDPDAPSGDTDTDPASTSTNDPGEQSAGSAGTAGTAAGKAGKAGKSSEVAPPGANPAGGASGGGSA